MSVFGFVRRRRGAAALSLLIGVLAIAQAGLVLGRNDPPAPRLRSGLAAPELDPKGPIVAGQPTESPSPSPSERPVRRAKKAASPPKPTPVRPNLEPFRGLGAWVDLWDYEDLDPAAVVADMGRFGVRTVYLQTGRFNTKTKVAPEVGPWLVAAHDAGMDVVGWYLPSYANMRKDVRRSVAIATYRYQGEAFDGIGIDIEWKNDVPNPEWNDRVVEHLALVRADVPRRLAVAAITPPPLQMDVAPVRWAGFPWSGIGANSDVIMLMSYWSYRDCENIPDHCAYPFTRLNIEETRDLIGRPTMPIHTIGGVGDRVTTDEVTDFVRGAKDARAYGGSLYDVRTTARDFWPVLARLRTL